jgi:hypothetical protein
MAHAPVKQATKHKLQGGVCRFGTPSTSAPSRHLSIFSAPFQHLFSTFSALFQHLSTKLCGFPNFANKTFANWTFANDESPKVYWRKYSGLSPIGESREGVLANIQWTLGNLRKYDGILPFVTEE